jgi:D-glycero-D-manno-heptose 1,7-bisphosphate phosphatase
MQDEPFHKALFLDRDGVINKNIGYISDISQFEFMPGIFELCILAKSKNYLIVIVTNQSGIGRKIFTIDQYYELTGWMCEEFNRKNCKIDLVTTSPINPNNESNSEGLKFRRKPNPGMIIDACEILNINTQRSILIGDSDSDIEAGISAGVKTLIKIGPKIKDYINVHYFSDLSEVLKDINDLML